ncbi:hypothetical protein ACOME3_010021 [Neoechinorhynchus agilis]
MRKLVIMPTSFFERNCNGGILQVETGVTVNGFHCVKDQYTSLFILKKRPDDLKMKESSCFVDNFVLSRSELLEIWAPINDKTKSICNELVKENDSSKTITKESDVQSIN